jgi:hypothetical protein
VEVGLVEFTTRVRFRHPLVRSAVYQSASQSDRQDMHAALAEATDRAVDPDRRAWHRAHATSGADENVAAEFEASANRAQDRGGSAAAATFFERAALLTPDPARRAQRLLAAARAKRYAGEIDAAIDLLLAAEADPLDAWQGAELWRLRGHLAADQTRSDEAAEYLLEAARRLEPLDPGLAREAHFEALFHAAQGAAEPG